MEAFELPVVSTGLSQSETYARLLHSLYLLQQIANSIFDSVADRTERELSKLRQISNRLQSARKNIDQIIEHKKDLIVYASPIYPYSRKQHDFSPLFDLNSDANNTALGYEYPDFSVSWDCQNIPRGEDEALDLFAFFSSSKYNEYKNSSALHNGNKKNPLLPLSSRMRSNACDETRNDEDLTNSTTRKDSSNAKSHNLLMKDRNIAFSSLPNFSFSQLFRENDDVISELSSVAPSIVFGLPALPDTQFSQRKTFLKQEIQNKQAKYSDSSNNNKVTFPNQRFEQAESSKRLSSNGPWEYHGTSSQILHSDIKSDNSSAPILPSHNLLSILSPMLNAKNDLSIFPRNSLQDSLPFSSHSPHSNALISKDNTLLQNRPNSADENAFNNPSFTPHGKHIDWNQSQAFMQSEIQNECGTTDGFNLPQVEQIHESSTHIIHHQHYPPPPPPPPSFPLIRKKSAAQANSSPSSTTASTSTLVSASSSASSSSSLSFSLSPPLPSAHTDEASRSFSSNAAVNGDTLIDSHNDMEEKKLQASSSLPFPTDLRAALLEEIRSRPTLRKTPAPNSDMNKGKQVNIDTKIQNNISKLIFSRRLSMKGNKTVKNVDITMKRNPSISLKPLNFSHGQSDDENEWSE